VIDAAGNIGVLYLSVPSSGSAQVRFDRLAAGATSFGTPVNIASSPIYAGPLALDPVGGNIFAIVTQAANANLPITGLYKSTDNGNTFSGPATVDNNINHTLPTVAAHGCNVVVLIIDATTLTQQPLLEFASTDGGSTFGSPVTLFTSPSGEFLFPPISVALVPSSSPPPSPLTQTFAGFSTTTLLPAQRPERRNNRGQEERRELPPDARQHRWQFHRHDAEHHVARRR
jgi:hypothetical protein